MLTHVAHAARAKGSPNHVLTHAARAAASLVAARGAREGLWLEQRERHALRALVRANVETPL